MIPRYTPADFAELWSQQEKYRTWFHVELAACQAMEEDGRVPAGTADKLRPFVDKLEAARIDEIEKTTKHDVIAFLTHVEELAGEPARWLHLGMTSSDVLDSSLAMLMVLALEKIETRLVRVIAAFDKRIREHARTPIIGRSHGIHAEPTTFGIVLAGHRAELARAILRINNAKIELAVGKIAGAVGSYAHLTLAIEKRALGLLGLTPETVATQVVSRDRHAGLHSALAFLAAAMERFATNMRHWQRNELLEAEEPFTVGQKGSSAMPHKRNPIASENLCGLARVVRAALTPALENIALWHERDISHSSVERMLLPDATTTTAYMLDRLEKLVEGMVVYPANMQKNLERAGGLWASEGILLALVRAGLGRQAAYVMVQRNAMKAFHGDGAFHPNLLADGEVMAKLKAEDVAREFDVAHSIRHADAIIERALSM